MTRSVCTLILRFSLTLPRLGCMFRLKKRPSFNIWSDSSSLLTIIYGRSTPTAASSPNRFIPRQPRPLQTRPSSPGITILTIYINCHWIHFYFIYMDVSIEPMTAERSSALKIQHLSPISERNEDDDDVDTAAFEYIDEDIGSDVEVFIIACRFYFTWHPLSVYSDSSGHWPLPCGERWCYVYPSEGAGRYITITKVSCEYILLTWILYVHQYILSCCSQLALRFASPRSSSRASPRRVSPASVDAAPVATEQPLPDMQVHIAPLVGGLCHLIFTHYVASNALSNWLLSVQICLKCENPYHAIDRKVRIEVPPNEARTFPPAFICTKCAGELCVATEAPRAVVRMHEPDILSILQLAEEAASPSHLQVAGEPTDELGLRAMSETPLAMARAIRLTEACYLSVVRIIESFHILSTLTLLLTLHIFCSLSS